MNNVLKVNFGKRKKLTSVLGLSLDGSRLEGVALKRTNGALQIQQTFAVTLTLDPMTAPAELVGREIRNHLDAVGVKERRCIVGVPLKWALTTHTELPKGIAEQDAASLLQLEAEKGFPSDTATLRIANSRCVLTDGKQYVLLTGIAATQLDTLEGVLVAAKLKPVSFALGLTALQAPERRSPTRLGDQSAPERAGSESGAPGVLSLAIGESQIGLQITCGGGVAALRALEGAIESEAGRRTLHADHVARESRITLGQLPPELREKVKSVRIFGPRDLAQQLADEMELRFEPMGLSVEIVSAYAPKEFGVTLPPEASVSPAFSLAARPLVDQAPVFEFLPPKPTALQLLATKYASGKLRTAGSIAAAIILIVAGMFGWQQFQLARLNAQWSGMAKEVNDLENLQAKIRQYRLWFDDSFRSLSILRQVTQAFPETGDVTAKTIEIRDGKIVSCSGNAQDRGALLATVARLRTNNVSDVKINQIRGKAPMQFTFDFRYGNGGANEN
jgi:hypothetical protein